MARLRGFCLLALALALGPAPAQLGQQTQNIDPRNKQLLSYLLERLNEPIFLPKGDSETLTFRVPTKFLNARFQPIVRELVQGEEGEGRGRGRVVDVPEGPLPDLGPALQLGRYEHFSLFIPRHRRMARRLIDIFLSVPGFEGFLTATAYCRDRINPYLFAYAAAVALRHRADTRSVPLPNAACLFPHNYLDGSVFPRIKMEANVLGPGQRRPIVIPRDWTATDLEPEHRVAYFREDVGINLCHWHWHLIYPFSGPVAVVRKDRRGELFYYFHQQIVARYNFERMSNDLSRVKRLLNWREPIPEAYFPKLNSQLSARDWPARHANAKLSDVQREDQGVAFDILDLERWRDRIMDAVHTRRAQTDTGEFIALDEEKGTDILGNMLESTVISINRNLYGDLHNFGHLALAYIHDPDNRHLEPFSVMGDASTALRDPIFYRWHAFMQSMFDEHKATLPRYTARQLSFPAVEVLLVEVQTFGSPRRNELNTFWQQSDIDISRGLDFAPRGPVLVRVTHLQHAPFAYRIQVRNTAGAPREGTVRIFLAPALDERRRALPLADQRALFVEMDKFRLRLAPGTSRVERWHNESSLAIPAERTFRNLDLRPGGAQGEMFDHCGCGWPLHMLVPRGSPSGLRATLFVMLSDYEDDRVSQTAPADACEDGHSLCGVLGQLYPDRRPMGFPFDRPPPPSATSVADFLTPNMAASEVRIVHRDRTVAPAAGPVADPPGPPA